MIAHRHFNHYLFINNKQIYHTYPGVLRNNPTFFFLIVCL